LSQPSGWRETVLTRAPAGLFVLFLCAAVAMALVWVFRGYAILNYTEGVVLGSLAGYQASGLEGLYPAGWDAPPLVLTLYPPVYFWLVDLVSSLAGADLVSSARLVSLLAATAAGWALASIRSVSGATWSWLLVLVGATAVLPGVARQLGAAQVDMLAASLTCIGVALALRAEAVNGSIWLPLLFFALAVFTKHTFVAAPAAVFLHRAASGNRPRALVEAAGFGALVVSGFLLINAWTGGGFLAHVLLAAMDSGSASNMVRVMADSAPHVWVPLAALVLVGSIGRVGVGIVPWWLGLSAVLHLAATWKTGASVNYFLEPALALAALGLVTRPDLRWLALESERSRRIGVVLFTALVFGATLQAVEVVRDARLAYGAVPIRVAEFEIDHPLVEADFFPAILEHGRRPYLNDPFAFGGLAESGTWDPSTLAADLSERRVPFALTTIDIREPLPDGARFEDELFGYFWRMPAVRDGLLGGYSPTSDGLVNVWVPTEGSD
jgi:hypothetical protein